MAGKIAKFTKTQRQVERADRKRQRLARKVAKRQLVAKGDELTTALRAAADVVGEATYEEFER